MILDTSVLLDAVIWTPFTHMATALLGSGIDLSAPDHIEPEAAGALTKAVRRGDFPAETARNAYALLKKLLPDIEASPPLMDRSFALSLELRHPLSDCLFLALAEREDRRLVTLDMRLVRKLVGTPYAHHVLALPDWQP